MKNTLHKCIALLTLALIITSCSQTQELAKNDGPQYRYKKVYVGNKIVYRDMDKKPKSTATTTEEESERKLLEPVQETKDSEKSPLVSRTEKQNTSSKEENFSGEVTQTFTRNLKEVRTAISKGSFRNIHQKRRNTHELSVSNASDDDDNTMIGTYEIFAIIGFAFGVASLFGGLVLAILGVIFSILGLNSGYRLFAVIGLICAIVGFILILI